MTPKWHWLICSVAAQSWGGEEKGLQQCPLAPFSTSLPRAEEQQEGRAGPALPWASSLQPGRWCPGSREPQPVSRGREVPACSFTPAGPQAGYAARLYSAFKFLLFTGHFSIHRQGVLGCRRYGYHKQTAKFYHPLSWLSSTHSSILLLGCHDF